MLSIVKGSLGLLNAAPILLYIPAPSWTFYVKHRGGHPACNDVHQIPVVGARPNVSLVMKIFTRAVREVGRWIFSRDPYTQLPYEPTLKEQLRRIPVTPYCKLTGFSEMLYPLAIIYPTYPVALPHRRRASGRIRVKRRIFSPEVGLMPGTIALIASARL